MHGRKAGSDLVAIYARQSVEKADSLSIQGQIDLCLRESGDEYRIYQDRGYSGKNTNRPEFQHLMTDVEKGIVSKIVVYRLDRFSRSISDFGRLWETLQEHNVSFVSINETFDTTTPMGRAMLNIIMVFAQLERETTSERVRDNYYQRAAFGAWPGGPAPYGFSIGKLPSADGRLMPALIANGDAHMVERIFSAYASPDASLGSVSRDLNAAGIPAPKRATWDSVTLSRLLHSPLYTMADEEIYLYYKGKGVLFSNSLEQFDGLHAGMLVGKRKSSAAKYRDVTNEHFSLANHYGFIPSELWLTCQHKLDLNRQLGGSGRGKHTFLSGLLKCETCGYSVKVNKSKDTYYLQCSGRSNLGLCEQAIRVDLRLLEEAVTQELEALLSKCPSLDDVEPNRSEDTATTLVKIEQKIERLMAALLESTDLSMQYLNRELERLEREKQELLSKGPPSRTNKKKAAPQRTVFSHLSFAEKKLVAAHFIKEIHLAEDRAQVIWLV